jgi:hypothetical protein
MRDAMFARGACAENGAATVYNMADELRRRGADIALQVNYSGNQMTLDWKTFLRQHVPEYPIVLQLAKSFNLANPMDVPTVDSNPRTARPGAGPNDFGYHAIAILGKQSNGYIVGDPDQAHGSARALVYSMQLLEACWPCGMIALRPKSIVVPVPSPIGGIPVADLPSGYSDKNDIITAPNGVQIIRGFANYIRNNPAFLAFAGQPLVPEYSTGNTNNADGVGVEQVFEKAGLCWTETKNVYVMSTGKLLQDTRSYSNGLNEQVAQLQKQVDQLKQDDILTIKALAAVKAMKEALG